MEQEQLQEQLQEQSQEQEVTAQNYLEQLNKIKAETVSKEAYEKLQRDNKMLAEALTTSNPAPAEKAEQTKSVNELRKELFHPDHELNNLEYAEKALALRKAVMEETGEDCFVGKGHQLNPTSEAYQSAERLAEVMQDAIDYANGDSEAFTNELMRRTKDVKLPIRK